MANTEFDESTLQIDVEGALAALENAGAKGPDLVQQWIAAGNAGAVNCIAEHGSGPARKAARRGLNVLKSRGVEIPHAPRKASLVQRQVHPVEALLLSPDSAGIRLLAFTQRQSGGSCRASLVFVRDGQGVLRVENSQTTLSKLRASISKALPGAGYEPVAVPLEWARDKVARARAAHTAKGAPEPMGFDNAKALLEPVPESTPEHPFDAEGFEFADDDARELAKDSGALHHLPEFRAWMPGSDAVRELLTKVGSHLDPEAPAEQEEVSKLLKSEMLSSTDRYFTEDRRNDLISWMKDAGISLLAREGEGTALKVAATIQVIGSCGITTNPPQEVPFLRAFFEKAVSVMMAQAGGRLNIPVPRANAAAG